MSKTLGLTLGLVAGLAFAGTDARAQALRPNILVWLDTSGSMLYNQSLDGSPLCNVAGGNRTAAQNTADGQTSRVYNMKNAIRAALAQVGTDEANFGLARFPQLEDAATTNCPAAHWNNGTTSNCNTSTTCTGVGGRDGCKMTTHNSSTPETAYGPWFDSGAGQILMVPVTAPASGLRGLTATDYDPTGANITSVYKWIDQSDSGMTGASNPDPELRIPPNTYTPLGRSMFYSRLYFENYVYPNDPKKACRQNILILATDGAETCDETAGTSIDPVTCAQTPANSYGTFHPVLQACLARRSAVIPKGVLVYILTDSSLTNAEKTTANQMASAGGTGQAIFVTLTDTNAVKQAIVDIIAKTVPPSEVCNGVDDNCNGLIDEGVSNMCTVAMPNNPADPDNQRGTSARHCAIEACNCIDDDCDGTVDEGFPPNACGQPCGCALPPERCDGLDNDCDGDVDEGFMVGASCMNNGVGICARGGILACRADMSGTFCDAPTVPPQTEVCNGLDDDCDGMIDEGTLPGVGERCGNGLGTCQSGTYVCQMGRLVCNATGMPMVETCNGIDDNCDGVIDNGTFPQTGGVCLCPGLTQAQIDQSGGVCKAGRLICRGSLGFVCEGCTLPTPEVCDGKDNNCDGMPDSMAMCPLGFACREGQCTLECVGGEFSCPAGYKCVNAFCVPQRCAGVTCPSGEKCDEATGSCVDLCTGVTCSGAKVCIEGRCLDCNDPALACTGTQLCVGGRCQEDKCLGVTCPSGRFCSDGVCKDLCLPGTCPEGQRCVGAGTCMEDKCKDVPCTQNQFCNPTNGKCEADRCPATQSQCGGGMICVSSTNTCIDDPCLTMRCPGDCYSCGVTKDGIGTCFIDGNKCKPVNLQVGQRGGAGCSCAVDGDHTGMGSSGALALLMALGLVIARRRRRAE